MANHRVCYIVNHYPKVSHSFIRREILGVEKAGVEVERVSVRGWSDVLVDATDLSEQARTTYILRSGIARLLLQAVGVALSKPGAFWNALRTAVRMSRRSDRTVLHHIAYLLEAATVAEFARKRGFDHIHAHFGTNSTDVALLASILTGLPFSFTVHGADEVDRPIALNLPDKVARARFVVAVSHYGRGQLYRWCALPHWQKIEVVHCGVDDSFLAEPPAREQFPPRIVCLGRLCNEKAQLLLLEAASELAKQGRRFELVLAGDGELRVPVEALIDRLGLQEVVSITGWIDGARVREEILAARAVVLPSLMEGIPVALMESLALARPVVTTFVGGIPELVSDGIEGWVVPAGSRQDLAVALAACLDASDDEIRARGAAGRQRVLAMHSSNEEAARLAHLFKGQPVEPR